MVARVYHHYLVWERCYSKGLEVVRNVGPPQLGPWALKPPKPKWKSRDIELDIYHFSGFIFDFMWSDLHWFTTYKLIIQYTIPGEPIRRFSFSGLLLFFGRRPKISERHTFGVICLCFGVVFLCFGVVFLVLFLHLACVMFLVETKNKYRMEVEVYIYVRIHTLII